MFCRNCGKEIASGKYCQYCGYKLADDKGERDDVEKKSVLYIKVIIFLIVFILIIIGIIGIFCRDKESEKATGINISEDFPKTEETDIDSEKYTEKTRENLKQVVIEGKTNEVVEKTKEVASEEIQTSNADSEETSTVGTDAHSIWFEGIEFKILEYIDEEDMLVKFALDDYIMQVVVPRELEEGNYISEHYSEWSGNGERCEVYLKLINASKTDAIYFAYAIGPERESEFNEWKKLVDNEDMIVFRTSDNKEGLVSSGYESIALNEYDKDKVTLPGYGMVVWNEEESMICAMTTLNEDEQRNEEVKENLKEIKVKRVEESDFYLKSDVVGEDYDARMSAMYQKYIEIIGSPTEYLKQNADAQGEDYTYHYLFDLTNDAIPEMIFKGTPRCIAIVGEKNAISLLGCDEIYLTDTPSTFYTQVAWQTDVTWTKHEMQVNEEGLLILNSSNYLEQTYEGVHRLKGEEITEDEYMKIVDEITGKDRPRMKLYDLDEEMASMGNFYRSVQLLSDNMIQ